MYLGCILVPFSCVQASVSCVFFIDTREIILHLRFLPLRQSLDFGALIVSKIENRSGFVAKKTLRDRINHNTAEKVSSRAVAQDRDRKLSSYERRLELFRGSKQAEEATDFFRGRISPNVLFRILFSTSETNTY